VGTFSVEEINTTVFKFKFSPLVCVDRMQEGIVCVWVDAGRIIVCVVHAVVIAFGWRLKRNFKRNLLARTSDT
jgi:hypothetical protein